MCCFLRRKGQGVRKKKLYQEPILTKFGMSSWPLVIPSNGVTGEKKNKQLISNPGYESSSISNQLCGRGQKLLLSLYSVACLLIELSEKNNLSLSIPKLCFLFFLRYGCGTLE